MSPRRTGEHRSTERLSRAFRALGHPHRLTVVRQLLGRAVACCSADRADDCALDPASCNVGELAQLVDIAPSTLSHHLKELQDAGVIERAREGRFLYCRVNEELMGELATVLSGEERDADRDRRLADPEDRGGDGGSAWGVRGRAGALVDRGPTEGLTREGSPGEDGDVPR